MHHDDAYTSIEAAELAKEPEPCQHTLMPVRFVDEGKVKACPCRGHECELPEVCSCGQPAAPLHECPYAAEIHNSNKLCDCCEECARQCALDI